MSSIFSGRNRKNRQIKPYKENNTDMIVNSIIEVNDIDLNNNRLSLIKNQLSDIKKRTIAKTTKAVRETIDRVFLNADQRTIIDGIPSRMLIKESLPKDEEGIYNTFLTFEKILEDYAPKDDIHAFIKDVGGEITKLKEYILNDGKDVHKMIELTLIMILTYMLVYIFMIVSDIITNRMTKYSNLQYIAEETDTFENKRGDSPIHKIGFNRKRMYYLQKADSTLDDSKRVAELFLKNYNKNDVDRQMTEVEQKYLKR